MTKRPFYGMFSSLRARLSLLVFLALAPALGLIIHSSYEQRRIETRKVETDAFLSVKLLSGLMAQKVEGARTPRCPFLRIKELEKPI